MATNLDFIQDVLEGSLAGCGASAVPDQLTRTLRRFELHQSVRTNATTTTNINELVIHRVPVASRIVSVKYTSEEANIAGHATNYSTITVRKRNGAGGAATIVAERALSTPTTDDLVQWVPVDVTVNAANASLTAGSIVTLNITKAGAGGVTFPTGVLTVTYEEL